MEEENRGNIEEGIIDPGCQNSVVGILTLLSDEDVRKVWESQKVEGGKYWFGKTAYRVSKELVIPVKIKGRNLSVRIKMLEGEIPLLIGRKTMEDWNMKLDFENKDAKIRWGNEMIHYDIK